ncbi:MAG: ferrous iron transport protein A [Clostridiales bacterium]|nr:ferrous iron transport protein A [Clostridiales bacterium]
MTLKDLAPGQDGVIKVLEGKGPLRRRLIDMGITPGTKVFIRKIAPLGDPIQISLRGYELSLRKEDASKIKLVEKK